MLGKRERVYSLGHRDLSGWEWFCKDAARDTASRFIEQVRRYKDRDTTTADVSESQFVDKFSTFFLEEVLAMSANGCTTTPHVGGNSSNYSATKLPHCYKPTRGGGKAWWNIFKWSKLSKGEAGLSSSRKISASSAEGRKVLEGVVNLLDMNDPQQCLSWQQCKLVLHLVQGNYQLEVFSPPKNTTPKMSLFCFLIEDVRPTTSLEIPDSNSSFVIKSHNHGEYVFDAGTEDLQRQWITNIKQYSGSRTSTHVGNGHLPTVSNGHISPPPSTSSHNSVNGAPPRTSKGKPPSPQFHIECLSENPVVIHHKQQQSKDGGNTLHRVDSEDSVLCSFVRNSPQRSPRRQVHSMFIDSPSQLRPLYSPPPSPNQSSPIRSPPPIPQRRGTRPRSISYSNPPSDGSEKNHSHRSIESPTSTLHDELHPGSLETGSASSSSSALHPVSLAAIQQRSHKAAMEPSRKVSAPVSPSQLHTQKQPQEREKYASADDLSGPSLLKPEGERNQGHIRSVSDAGRSAPAPSSAEQRATERYIATPENESTEVLREEVNFTSDTSRSSSTSDAEQQSVNPIYVETTESQGYSQAVTYTHHPYASWATTHQDVQNLRNLSQFPWFHGMISRANASQLVLADGEGRYFVRQSESREGDFVLTFNYHNRAKHLRMTVDETGCNIQHLWFNDVPSMLDYFKTNSIPLESFWLNEDVKLSTYIDRAASDAFRTTTVVNVDRLHRTPPRRSRSLHLGRSNAITPSPTEQQSVSQGSSSNSLPQVVRGNTGWRQLFRSQRSSSAGNVGRVQRRHSTNAGSMLDARRPQNQQDNNYVYRY